MRVRRWWPVLPAVLVLVLVAAVSASTGTSAVKTSSGAAAKPSADRAILFASDGMRQDLVRKYAAEGAMPAYKALLDTGVEAAGNGLLQGFPPNTGVGWNTLSTGTWPGEHGSTNNTFFRTGEGNFNNSTGFATTGILQADHIAQAAERAGKTVVSMEWVGARTLVPALQGPVVDFRTFIGGRGIVLNFDIPGQTASSFGVQYQQRELDPAGGWSNVPASYSDAKETFFTHANSQIPGGGVWDVYVYDSTDDGVVNYDRTLVVNRSAGKNGSATVARLTEGQWADAKVTLASGTFAGRTAGFYMKLIDLSPDAETFRLYFTSVQRTNATYNGLGSAGSTAFEETLNARFPTSTAADFAPLEAGIVDEDTYIEQGLAWKDAHWRYLRYILSSGEVETGRGDTITGLGVQPNLLLAGAPVTDEFSHQFMGLVTPTDMDGNANPYYDDLTNDDVPDGRVAVREGYIRSAYELGDGTLALARSLVAGDEPVFASSDHGFAPQWYAVNVSRALVDLGLQEREQSGNCRKAANDPGTTTPGDTLAKECHAGGTAQIYLNVADRDPATGNVPQIPKADYEAVRNRIVAYFENLDDPNLPGQQRVVAAVYKKEQLRNVDGSDSLHPNRSGDVVVVFRPPYQTDAATPGQLTAFSQFFGQHGYLPNLVDLEHNVNMRSTFVAAGPGIKRQAPAAGMRAIDVAPTLAFLLGINQPQQARGKIRLDLLEGTENLREIDVLDISDFHGQLTATPEAADTLSGGGALNPTFLIGGAAFLKPWLDAYRNENPGRTLTVTAGDAVGATPPISGFFGDKPTIEIMNMMGFDLDGLGNHNFDRGEQYLRRELIPLAKFKYVSANVLNSRTGDTPNEWSKSRVFDFSGFKLGVIGFTNPDAPTLVKPGSFGPFQVTDPVAAVNQRAEQLKRRSGVGPIVAIGHLGVGTATAGPLFDFADAVKNVDAVIGDHTNFQVLTTRPNGVLVAENLSKGVRFTRVRLIVDSTTGEVVYKTADFHKPWTIGVTPDPAIQRRIDQLTDVLRPILSVVVGKSTVEVLRSDSCARSDGRLCESRVGNAITDAMRSRGGTQFAISNSGGLRAALTCPPAGGGDGFCPSFTPPPWLITRGQVFAVLPFNNTLATLKVSGAELKTYLENSVSAMPSANGRFAQVSGLCFRYDVSLPAGSRVVSVVMGTADGGCSSTPVDLTAPEYTLAINDFMMTGGDGYPNVLSRSAIGDELDKVVTDYLQAQPNNTINPVIRGRITCVKVANPASPNACPPITAP